MKLHRILCLLITAFLASGPVHAVENNSSIVYPGADGKLVYIPDVSGNSIPDFSHAGYGGGGIALPYVPVKETVWPVTGDNAPHIQAAIDRVSALAQDEYGFRGAVLLKKGWYTLDSPLYVAAIGVVLRGEGQNADGTVLFGRGKITRETLYDMHFDANLVIVHGSAGKEDLSKSAVEITDTYVPVGSRLFNVESSKDFSVGEKVIVRRRSNDEWFRIMGKSNLKWKETTRTLPKHYDFDRIITAVDGTRITVDAPITVAIEDRFGGGEIVPYNDPGRLYTVGIENLRGESDFDRTVRSTEYGNMDRSPYYGEEYYADENHYWNFIHIDNAVNVWVRNVTACHFAGSAIFLGQSAKWVTVQDCESVEPVSNCQGLRRYTFQICGQLCLVQRCESKKGRHTFVMGGFQTCGPNVFLDCIEHQKYGSSEPHMSLVSGALYDNVNTAITLRYAQSSVPRWMSINSTLWNCEGMFLCQKPPVGQNYVFGQIGIHAMIFNKNLLDYNKPQGFIESWDRHVSPRSLYHAQLADRLGEGTAEVTTPR